ncbi:hypothetical protein O181_012563 [Austropuccinia psidii MF-1]|uniref:Uncharacterized protein n=1 Tax=Austropuccinia psidii MF-1 TaxID=1389203 RepID=A0A9Q3BX08_9BASI|nr:hypothetical protein [Austropuccinia psidii MF-1]
MKNEQFGLYGSVGKIENTKDEWKDQGANLSSVGRILGKSLCLSMILTLQTQNLAMGQHPDSAKNSLCLLRLPTLVQVPSNSSNSFHRGSLLTTPALPYASVGCQHFTHKSLSLYRFRKFKKFLTLVQAFDNLHTTPYAREGFRCFTRKSLCLYRFPTIQIIPYAGEASQHF